MLKESDNLVILRVPFVSKLLWETSSFGFQSSFSKAWYLEDVLESAEWSTALWEMLSGLCFARFLKWSAGWFSAADHTLNYLTWGCAGMQHGVSSVEELYMLYKIRCNSMHPLYDPLPVMYVPVRVISGALVVRILDAEPCSTAGLLIPSQCLVEQSVRLYSMVFDCSI